MRFRIPLLSRALRLSRINDRLEEIEHHERQMRNALAALIELTDPGDDLHVEAQRLLGALDG